MVCNGLTTLAPVTRATARAAVRAIARSGFVRGARAFRSIDHGSALTRTAGWRAAAGLRASFGAATGRGFGSTFALTTGWAAAAGDRRGDWAVRAASAAAATGFQARVALAPVRLVLAGATAAGRVEAAPVRLRARMAARRSRIPRCSRHSSACWCPSSAAAHPPTPRPPPVRARASETDPTRTRKTRCGVRSFFVERVIVDSNAAFGPLTRSRLVKVRARARARPRADSDRLCAAGSCEPDGIGERGKVGVAPGNGDFGKDEGAELEPRFPYERTAPRKADCGPAEVAANHPIREP